MLRFLFRLTISLSSGAVLAVLLITLVTYFFPDPTGAKWQAGQHAQFAKVLMRTTPQEEPVGRPTQAPAGTQKVSEQITSPAADIRPPSEGIPGDTASRRPSSAISSRKTLRTSPFWSVRCGAERAVGAQRTVGATGISLRQGRSRCGHTCDCAVRPSPIVSLAARPPADRASRFSSRSGTWPRLPRWKPWAG